MKQLEQDLGWNRKRIFALAAIGIILLAGGLIYLGKTGSQVKGTATYVPPPNDTFDQASNQISEGIKDKIISIQEDAKSLNVADVASSSPQVQKVIKDIQSIQDLPSDKAKDACQKICNEL